MDILEKIVVPVVTVLVSGVLAFLTARVEARAQLRRQQRLDYLLSAYRTLTNCAHRELSPDRAYAFEQAMADVLLLGTPEHIKLAASVRDSLAREGSASVDGLLIALRRDLRSELGISASELEGVPILRMAATESETRET
ncbi:hypothetical protein ACFUJR_38625 [Streptomyces sp. NPDC057271]|uniref:hypothetical protein n=1 Tax=unclassified Streptomyces TaxID=2593676 RepID=UPI003641CE20